jgi:hypothetical protein
VRQYQHGSADDYDATCRRGLTFHRTLAGDWTQSVARMARGNNLLTLIVALHDEWRAFARPFACIEMKSLAALRASQRLAIPLGI